MWAISRASIIEPGTGDSTSMVSQNGTVGYTVRKIQSFDYRWTDDSLLIMHSDGLATHWNMDRYPGLSQRHPSLIAGRPLSAITSEDATT